MKKYLKKDTYISRRKTDTKWTNENYKEISKERYISPEQRQAPNELMKMIRKYLKKDIHISWRRTDTKWTTSIYDKKLGWNKSWFSWDVQNW